MAVIRNILLIAKVLSGYGTTCAPGASPVGADFLMTDLG